MFIFCFEKGRNVMMGHVQMIFYLFLHQFSVTNDVAMTGSKLMHNVDQYM
jgi:hypothetical protein